MRRQGLKNQALPPLSSFLLRVIVQRVVKRRGVHARALVQRLSLQNQLDKFEFLDFLFKIIGEFRLSL